NGSMTSVSWTGSSKTTTIPTAVRVWQMAIVTRLPSQLPIHPQASFPAAPPIKPSVNANPAVVTAAPFTISRNGRHTKKLLRTTLGFLLRELATEGLEGLTAL